jgi:acetyl esterase/lipase
MRILLLLATATCLLSQASEPLTSDASGVFPIWPGTPPGSENWTWREQIENRGGNRMVRNVVSPTLTMYKPAAGKANGASVIIAPGGAFRFLMVDYEGVDLARWLVERGVTAFVLKYRLMRTPEDEAAMSEYLRNLRKTLAAADTKSENPPAFDDATKAAIALAEDDGRQAIRYVRQHAAEWSLDPNRIGIAGFSAGGGVVMGQSCSTMRQAVLISPRRSTLRTARPFPFRAMRRRSSSSSPTMTNSSPQTPVPGSTAPGTPPATLPNFTSSIAAIRASE